MEARRESVQPGLSVAAWSRIVRRAVRLDAAEKSTALRALGWLVLVHTALQVLPYRRVRRLVTRVRPSARRPALTAPACAVAASRAAVVFPWAQCLARALAAECQLRRAGRHAQLHIGVGFDEARTFLAHAWLESDGLIVTGGGEAACCGYKDIAP